MPYSLVKTKSRYGPSPDYYIPFPGSDGDRLWLRYSAKSVCPQHLEAAFILHQQLEAHSRYLINPPLGGEAPLGGVDEETVKMRNKTILWVVGVSHMHLNTGGLSSHTVKLRVQHITQAKASIASGYYPKQPSYVSPNVNVDESKAWCKNLNAKVLVEGSYVLCTGAHLPRARTLWCATCVRMGCAWLLGTLLGPTIGQTSRGECPQDKQADVPPSWGYTVTCPGKCTHNRTLSSQLPHVPFNAQ